MVTIESRTVEDIARGLAERKAECPCDDYFECGSEPNVVYPCNGLTDGRGYIPDPRFDALRGKHDWVEYSVASTCRSCGWSDFADAVEHDPEPPYCLRTDLGAAMHAASDCGLVCLYFGFGGRLWVCTFAPRGQNQFDRSGIGSGETPELAAFNALEAAVT